MLVRGRRLVAWLAAILGAAMLTVMPAQPASASLPAICGDPLDANVYRWVGGQADHDWMNPQNWVHGPTNDPGAPNDNKSTSDPWTPGANDDTQNTIVCIDANDFTELDNSYTAYVWVQELYVEGNFTIHLKPENTGLLVMGTSNESSLGPGVTINQQGTLGGTATIHNFGTITARSVPNFPAQLSSQAILPAYGPDSSYGGPAGQLVVETGGRLDFSQRGVGLNFRYQVLMRGSSTVANDAYIAANHGTRFEIAPGGSLRFTNDGGYYQGITHNPPQPSVLVNGGQVAKQPPGTGTTVIDANYSQPSSGRLVVESGTIAFPGGTTHTAQVRPGQAFSTEKCVVNPGPPPANCTLTTDPSIDPESITLTVPRGDSDGASVRLLEHPVAGGAARTARRAGAVIFDADAHADGLRVDEMQPAIIEMRFDARRADGRPLDNLAVYQDDKEIQTCLGTTGAPSLGQVACIDRRGQGDSTRNLGGNVYVVVRATSTSRWKIRRELEDVAAPTLFTPAKQKKGNLGSAVQVATKCDEKCTLKGSGSIKVKGLGKLKLQKDKAKGKPGKRATLKLVLTPASARKLKQSNAKKGTATVTFKATDQAGNSVRERVKVKLR